MAKQQKQYESLDLTILSDKLFGKFSRFVEEHIGIKMPNNKRIMLQARLMKRLRVLGIPSFEEYYEYVFQRDPTRTEIHNMIDVITTNKTDFFREAKHFDYLSDMLLPQYLDEKTSPSDDSKHLHIWCAGCSSGEEPYTLAMVLQEFVDRYPYFDFSIFATDISNRMLEQAKSAIYPQERIEPIPETYRKKYLLRHKMAEQELVRIIPELREKITFERLNLHDKTYQMRRDLDLIFCRNVIIYFERSFQERIVQQLCTHLKPIGHLFMGHSEALNGMELPLRSVARTIYQKIGTPPKEETIPRIALNPPAIYVRERPSVVSTLLGSCVAITMFNRNFSIS